MWNMRLMSKKKKNILICRRNYFVSDSVCLTELAATLKVDTSR